MPLSAGQCRGQSVACPASVCQGVSKCRTEFVGRLGAALSRVKVSSATAAAPTTAPGTQTVGATVCLSDGGPLTPHTRESVTTALGAGFSAYAKLSPAPSAAAYRVTLRRGAWSEGLGAFYFADGLCADLLLAPKHALQVWHLIVGIDHCVLVQESLSKASARDKEAEGTAEDVGC